ncbi:MAG: hypothetical protein ACRESR_07135 [Gammaproteobacteria bacterium]
MKTKSMIMALSFLLMGAVSGTASAGSDVPDGTLTYKIVFTGQATTRSAEENAADAKTMKLPLKTIADSETIHRVIEGTIRLHGVTWQSDPLADEAQSNALDEAQTASNAQEAKRSADFEKAMRACKSGDAVDMDCLRRVGRTRRPALAQDSDRVEASLKRFDLWRATVPCQLKIHIADKAGGVIFAGAAGGATGELYRLTNEGTKAVDCPSSSADESGPVVFTADTKKHLYSVRFPAVDVESQATKAYEVTDKVAGEGIKRSRGKTAVSYTLHVPAIVIRRLQYPGAGKALSGSKHIEATMTVRGAMGVGFIKFPREGGAPVQASLPLDTVVTWAFTPDKK